MNNKHIITLYACALLVYAGWRTYDYMAGSLQGVTDTTRLLVAMVFLFASEIGLLMWLHVGRPKATTDIQEAAATSMIFVNFVGSMILGLADVLKHNTMYFVELAFLDPILLLAPWVLIVANVGGYLIYHMTDSEEQLSRAERRLSHEEIRLEMLARQEAINELKANMKGLASKLAPHYVKDLTDRVEGRTSARFNRAAQKLSQGESSGNGRESERVYPAEVDGSKNL